MDLRKLKTLIDLVAESGISELEVTETDGKVRIVKSPSVSPLAHPVMAAPAVVAAPGSPGIPAATTAGGSEMAAPPAAAAPKGGQIAYGRNFLPRTVTGCQAICRTRPIRQTG
jgi:acetyl-CoA carboxylase biotin carboxyl carrier protein